MRIDQIRLRNFRNYSSCQFVPDPGMNVIIGQNAQGKTNLLESIVLLSTTRSHRASRDQDMIREGEEYCRVECTLHGQPQTVLSAIVHDKGKTLMIQKKPVYRSSEFIGKLNAVLFAPADLEIFEAPPKVRRRMMDVEIGKISSRYMQTLSSLMKILKERNSLLKRNQIDDAMMDILDEQLADLEIQIIRMRRAFISRMNQVLSRYYCRLSDENANITVVYHTVSETEDLQQLKEELITRRAQCRERDQILKTTSFGVHRDDLSFMINDHDVISYASQGQRRMVVLAWKMSLIAFISEQLKEKPVLLLDDVLSELDHQKRVNLFSLISTDIQTFITTTEIDDILDFISVKPKIAKIENGQIREWKGD